MKNRIKELRTKAGLSQKKLAALVDTHHQQIARLETGQARLTQAWMERLAPFLNCQPWQLMTDSGGGLTLDEEDILNKYRSLSPKEKKVFHEHFSAWHERLVVSAYRKLSKGDRETVDWFLFQQTNHKN